MIAKEYTDCINAYFRENYKRRIGFINKETVKQSTVHFGDRKAYRIEIWAVNYDSGEKSLVFVEQEVVKYEDGKISEADKKDLIKGLWILTLNNLDRINKYGV